jgi:hypothetical protein
MDLALFLLILFSGLVPARGPGTRAVLEFGVVDRGQGVAGCGCEGKEIDASPFLWGVQKCYNFATGSVCDSLQCSSCVGAPEEF